MLLTARSSVSKLTGRLAQAREPHMAAQTLPAAADALAVLGRAGINDL